MKRLWFILVLVLLLAGTTACEHKDLCYAHPHFATIQVVFNWDKISDRDKPEGMRVVFFPKNKKGDTWTFDFPGGKDGRIEIPENDYHVICFNYDTDGMIWVDEGDFTLFTADTRDAQSPDGMQMSVTPPYLCGDHITDISLKDIPKGTERVVPLTPVSMVCRYTYEVNGIRGLERVEYGRRPPAGESVRESAFRWNDCSKPDKRRILYVRAFYTGCAIQCFQAISEESFRQDAYIGRGRDRAGTQCSGRRTFG